jgi:UDPglucose 6-dehydrogenase
MTNSKCVCVVGLWHLGSVNCVGFAEKGYRVVGLDFNPARADKLQAAHPPLFEPGLEDAFRRHLASGNLRFSSDPNVVAEADWVVIAYDSPVNDQDEVDVSPVIDAAERVAPYLKPGTPLVVTSQVPLGTCERIETDVRRASPSWVSGVVYTPENLRLGTAIERFLTPDMLVLGASVEGALDAATALYAPFDAPKIRTDLRTAEMVKHALNTFLATSITFINEIANLCDRLGADAVTVGQALKCDKRIGPRALMSPGLGFSGGTLARDVTQLLKFAAEHGYDATLLNSIVHVNEATFTEVVHKLESRLGRLAGARIGILGLTYKPGTSTVRRSPAIKVVSLLRASGAVCVAFDPQASDEELSESGIPSLTRASNPAEVFAGADAVVLLTEWDEFRRLDYASLAATMKRRVFIDSKNFLDPSLFASAHIDYQGFGRRVGRMEGERP